LIPCSYIYWKENIKNFTAQGPEQCEKLFSLPRMRGIFGNNKLAERKLKLRNWSRVRKLLPSQECDIGF